MPNISSDENGLIWVFDTSFVPSQRYVLSTRSGNFDTFEKDILVYHKNSFQTKNIKDVGDKMNLFFLYYRDEIVFEQINSAGFLDGITIYQEYDESSGTLNSYLYDFPLEDIDFLNESVSKLVDSKYIQEKPYFVAQSNIVKVIGYFNPLNELFTNLQKQIISQDYDYLISFLFGLTLAYGKFDFKGDDLLGAKIHIPLIKNLIQKKEIFDDLINFFTQNGMFSKSDLLQNKFGYTYQISISDWEILQSFINFLSQIIGNINNNKFQKMIEFRQKLINYIEKEGDFGNIEFTEDIQSGILKILEK